MKIRNFLFLIISISLILGLLIYWREATVRKQINLFYVLIWQLGIWIPWFPGFKILGRIIEKSKNFEFGILVTICFCILWVGLHFAWFFYLSSTFSPYLDLPGSRFGVYRYFFIFWTLIDFALIWFIIDKLKAAPKKEQLPQPLWLE